MNWRLTRFFIAADDVNKVLKEAGVKGDKKAIETMIKLLEGKTVAEMINEGYGKFAQMSTGGGGGAAATEAPAAGGAAPAEKKEEKPKEESEEMDLGGGLFGDEDDYWAISLVARLKVRLGYLNEET